MNINDIAEINPKIEVGHLDDDALVSFIPMSDVTDDGRWLGSDSRKLSSVRRGYTAFAENDVLFAKITPCMENGKGARVRNLSNGVGFGSTEYHVLRARSEEEGEYVFQWSMFRELRGHAANAMTGSAGQQRVPADFLRKYPVFAHEPIERVAVGAVLRKLDHAIEQTEALLAKQQRIKTGLMHDLLTRGLDTLGRLRDPATHKFKNSPFGLIPDEWTVMNIEDLCDDIVDCPHSTPKYESGGVPCIRTADMVPGKLLLQNAYRVSSSIYKERVARLVPQKGDIIYSREGERLGIASPVGDELVCLGQRVMLLRPKVDTDSTFLTWAMNSPSFYNRVVLGQIATTSPHINVRDIKNALVVRPEPPEQMLIGEALAADDSENAILQGCLEKLRRLKVGLMHDLLTGVTPVTPLLALPMAPISS